MIDLLRDAIISRGTAKLPMDLQFVMRDHALWIDSNGRDGKRKVHKDGSEPRTFQAVNLRGVDIRNAVFTGALLTDAATDDTLTEGIDSTSTNIKGTNL